MSVEYLNNKFFEELVEKYKRLRKKKKIKQKEFEIVERALADAFYILADNIIRAFRFQMLDKDDMMQEAVMICFEKLDRFNPNYITANGTKSKFFNYASTIIINAFRALHRSAKNYKQLKERYYEALLRKNEEKILGSIYDKIKFYHDEVEEHV